MAKPKKVAPELQYARLPIRHWTVIGMDLSLSRTGFAVLHVENGEARWAEIGSIAPKTTEDETWARAAAIAIQLKEHVQTAALNIRIWNRAHAADDQWGLIVAMEFPDPNNSYLMSLNGVAQAVLWSSGEHGSSQEWAPIYRLAINASTLRATLRLNIKGLEASKNVNMDMARTFLETGTYPALDTDSCDAVLLAMMGRHAVMVLTGRENMVPRGPLNTLCTGDVKVKVRSARTAKNPEAEPVRIETPKALLQNPATWTQMQGPIQVDLRHTDAAAIIKKKPITTTYL